MTRPILASDISDAASTKPLGKFGSAVVRRPVSDGRRKAEADDLTPSQRF